MNNLLKRSISGILFCAVLITSLTFFPPLFPVAVILSIYMMMKEFYLISLGEEYRLESKLFIFSACILFAGFFISRDKGAGLEWTMLSIVPMFAAMVILMCRKNVQETYFKIPYLFMGLLYIGIPTALTPILVFKGDEFNGMLMLDFFIVIWASDIGAYCIGTLLGQKENSRKLAPKISPKKSWWGVAGGVIFSIGAGLGLYFAGWLEMSLVHSLVLSIILCAGGICGDLFESLFKRFFHVKDSGNAIPGHGGFLDRFDSSLVAMPLAATYLAIFNLI